MRVHHVVTKRSPTRPLLLSLVVLAATVLAFALPDAPGTAAVAVQTVKVVKQQVLVAARDLSPDRPIARDDLRVELRSVDALIDTAILEPEQVIGRTPAIPVTAGDLIVPAAIATQPRKRMDEAERVVAAATTEKPVTEKHVAEKLEPVAEVKHPQPPAVPQLVRREEVPAVRAEKPDVRAQLVPELVAPNPAPARRSFSNYVWVSGSPVSFGVDSDGTVKVLDQMGNSAPLRGRGGRAPLRRAR